MKTPENNPNPKTTPDQKNSGNVSRPKDPNNDPDQTPERETHKTPKADPGKQAPGTDKPKTGFDK